MNNKIIKEKHMKKQFENYLIEKGYKITTPSGLPSTVYDYIKRIDYVCKMEGYSSWEQLADVIPEKIREYDVGGIKEELGRKSHNAVISALVQFKNFVLDD